MGVSEQDEGWDGGLSRWGLGWGSQQVGAGIGFEPQQSVLMEELCGR